MMGKSLSAVWFFVMYCELNIYEFILTIALPMAAITNSRANVPPCLFHCTVLPHKKTFLSNRYWCCMPRQTSLKLVHYCALLSMTLHFDTHIIVLCATFHSKIKQAIKLNGFSSKQYQWTVPLTKCYHNETTQCINSIYIIISSSHVIASGNGARM